MVSEFSGWPWRSEASLNPEKKAKERELSPHPAVFTKIFVTFNNTTTCEAVAIQKNHAV